MGLLAEDGAEVFLEGIDEDIFKGKDSETSFFKFASALGNTHFPPVGRTVAGAREAWLFDEGFQKDGAVSVAGEPIGPNALGDQGKEAGGEVGSLYPRGD